MRRILALSTAAALLLAGCTSTQGGTLGPAPTLAPVGPSATAPEPTTSGPTAPGPTSVPPPRTGGPSAEATSGTITIQLWLTRAGRLAPTQRTRPRTLATSRLALTELAAGPSAAERRAGLSTAVPTRPGAVEGIRDRVAVVEVPPGFSAGPAAVVRLRQAQVVYTLTQFPTVTRVRFGSGGEPVGRSAFADLLPPIVVLAPAIGQRVSSPVTVQGTADVFEATVNVRILDAAGRQLVTAFTTATCGSGCRGAYRVTLSYRSDTGGAGTVEAYQVSAEDGTRRDLVAVPVTLTASR
jgi:hypothetical protein